MATGITAVIGAGLGALATALVGERVRSWLVRRHSGKGETRPHGLVFRIWERYGVIGLGLLAPPLTGAPLGVALGLTLGAPVGRLLLWMSLGIVLWSIPLTLVGALGIEGIKALWH